MGVEKHKCDGGDGPEKSARKTVGKHDCVSPSSSSSSSVLNNTNNNTHNNTNNSNNSISTASSSRLRETSSVEGGHGSLSLSALSLSHTHTPSAAYREGEREGEGERQGETQSETTDNIPQTLSSSVHNNANVDNNNNNGNGNGSNDNNVHNFVPNTPTITTGSLPPSFLSASFVSSSSSSFNCCAADSCSSDNYNSSPFVRAMSTAAAYGSMYCSADSCSPSPNCSSFPFGMHDGFPADFLRTPFTNNFGSCSPNDNPSCDPYGSCGPYGPLGVNQFAEEMRALLAAPGDQLIVEAVEGGDDDEQPFAATEVDESSLTVREEPMWFEDATYEDVFIDQGELEWMMITEENEDSSSHTHTEELRLVLPSDGGSVLHDADFGVRINAAFLQEYNPPDSHDICYLREIHPRNINIFWQRKPRTEAPHCPDYLVSPPAPLCNRLQWYSCKDEDRVVFGIKSAAATYSLRKEKVTIYDYALQKYDSRFMLRVVTLSQPQSTFFLDVYESDGRLRGEKGEFAQQNSLGEIYIGWKLHVCEYTTPVTGASTNTCSLLKHAKIYTHTNEDREVLKLIKCASAQPVFTVEDMESVLQRELALRNEKITQEIRGMRFLRSLGERLSLPFHDYTSLLQHPGRFIAICADYAPDRCLLHFALTHKKGEGCRLTEREAKHVMRQVCAQLAAMHAHGFAHQDISSENILLRRPHSFSHAHACAAPDNSPAVVDLMRLECVLMDYGQSRTVPYCRYTQRYLPVHARTDRPVGKPTFHAPELVHDVFAKYDAFAVDAYQLGVTMFIMLLAQTPFIYKESVLVQERASFFEILRQDRLREMEIGNPPTRISSLLSADSLDLLRQLLHFRPEDRPSIESVLNHHWLHSRE